MFHHQILSTGAYAMMHGTDNSSHETPGAFTLLIKTVVLIALL